jgi:hypothetical protein
VCEAEPNILGSGSEEKLSILFVPVRQMEVWFAIRSLLFEQVEEFLVSQVSFSVQILVQVDFLPSDLVTAPQEVPLVLVLVAMSQDKHDLASSSMRWIRLFWRKMLLALSASSWALSRSSFSFSTSFRASMIQSYSCVRWSLSREPPRPTVDRAREDEVLEPDGSMQLAQIYPRIQSPQTSRE